MTRIKICGLNDVTSALIAAESGADLLGFVFAVSKRQVFPEQVKRIVTQIRDAGYRQEVVGVFVNDTSSEVNRIAEYCRLDRVQLSGNETWEYCREIEYPVIKVIHVLPIMTADHINAEIKNGNSLFSKDKLYILLDSHSERAYGGTGRIFSWELINNIKTKVPVVIAGGLNTENVRDLVREYKPWGVDTSSGVETTGKKDPVKIRSFIRAVRQAEK